MSAIVNALENDSAVAAIVGDRINANQANQGAAFPYIVVDLISNEHAHHATAAAGVAHPTFQITCWETEPGKNETLATAVREALDGFTGTLGSGGDTAEVKSCILVNETNISDKRDGAKFDAHGTAMELRIMHTETVPTF